MSTVKYFHSAMTGAPTLNGTAGTLIAVLDACLVNGFGLRTVDSLTVASGIATMNIAAGHSFEPDTIALVSGATPTALNGEKVVLSTTTNTVTFAAPGVADQTATGAINCRLAPAGWEKLFSGTNLAAYRSLDVASTRTVLRVDDTAAQNARVVGYESMTDINTGVGPFPTNTQVSGGGWWPKANAGTAATARAWTLIASGRTFYLHVNTHTTPASLGASGIVYGFGDFSSFKSGDAFSCFLQAGVGDNSAATTAVGQALEQGSVASASLSYVPRSFTAIGAAIACPVRVESYQTGDGLSGTGSNAYASLYPNPSDNSLILIRKLICETSPISIRGTLPGIYHTPQNCHANFAWRDKINGQGALSGRKLMAIKAGAPAGTTSASVLFFDVTGPW